MQTVETGHPVVFAQALALSFEKQNLNPDAACAFKKNAAPFLDLENTKCNFRKIALFFEQAASIKEDPILGFHAGCEQDFRAAGLIAYVALSSKTLGGFINALVRYFPLFSKDLSLSIKGGHRLVFEIDESEKLKNCQFTEFFLTLLLQAMRHCTKTPIVVGELTFRHSPPEDYSELQRFFGGSVIFDANVTSMLLPSAALNLPLMSSDPYLNRLLTNWGDSALSANQTDTPRFVARIEEELLLALPSGNVSQHHLATRLGMSVRTLSRRLAQYETSYFALLDQMRHNMALSYLSEGELSLTEISTALGYASLSSFSDAFKRWTGQTPKQFRGVFRR